MTVVGAFQANKYEAVESACLDSSIVDFNSFISQLASLLQYERMSESHLRPQRKCGTNKQFFAVCGLKTGRKCHSFRFSTSLE
ncbi:hypothetical protein PHMEG_00012404 [Phytophthora megakarya]|uniref:Uncharacterized protein n=1 Tax=Phytophthora megakarya TaxID=4795 RepID=A0A225WAH8_9STRA|nr:hypothetical protein PHMEG_00012404 [Phytophthora megakarya]